jgi:DNA-binding response OmpR family regulator
LEVRISAAPGISVLIVEDEPLVRAHIRLGLEREGLAVDEAGDGATCLAAVATRPFDVVVLDLGLPDLDGVALAAELRARSPLGLIVVTRRAEMEARIEALDVGADDYLVKPAHPAELAARIRSVVRRRGPQARRRVGLGDWRIDLDARTVTGSDGRDAGLTPGEFALLARLVEADGRVVAREELLESVSRNPHEADPRTVDMLVSRLRRKLRDQGGAVATAPGYGYRLDGAFSD